jgi:pantothenate synthetase
MSRIWRIRAVRAAHSGNQTLAEQTVKELEAAASSSRNRVIQASYQGAAGTLLMDQKKYEEAITHLEEDQDNPLSMELLVQAYYHTSQPEKLHDIEVKLRGTNVPTMEQALVVPAARSRKPTS